MCLCAGCIGFLSHANAINDKTESVLKLLLAIGLIAIIALIGSRLTFFNRRLPIGIKSIFLTGTEYIFIGMLLGKMGINILDDDALTNFEPFLIFGLSLIGFLFGLQFQIKRLKRLPRYYFSITAIQAAVTFLVVIIIIYPILNILLQLPETIIFMSAITLGSIASCTAQSALVIISRNYRIENQALLNLMRYISSVDGFFALAFFAIALCVIPGGKIAGFNLFESINWLTITTLMGVVPALILILLNRVKFSQQEFIVFLTGTIMFCGGLAFEMHHSPVISGLICGAVTANFCRHRVRALSILVHAEKSVYIIMLLLIGAGLQFKVDYSLIITAVYFIVRVTGKLAGAFIAIKLFNPIFKAPPAFGVGLLSEGGIAIAIILNFRLLYPSFSDSITTVVILSVIINELIAPRLILAQFKNNTKQTDTRHKGR